MVSSLDGASTQTSDETSAREDAFWRLQEARRCPSSQTMRLVMRKDSLHILRELSSEVPNATICGGIYVYRSTL